MRHAALTLAFAALSAAPALAAPPTAPEPLVLENPIGLEDYREKVPYQTVEQQVRALLGQTEETLRRFIASYFVTWRPEYEPLALVPYRFTLSAVYPRYALASALTYQMR